MSGSTMLMAVSSSGAVTITGEISGSDAANALLLSGTGSVGFTTTSSFLAVSSSQQQVSASYIALSASYNTFSGSASTRITVDSASLLQVSSSQQQISASLLQVSASYISLSGSYNTFSGSASTRITENSSSIQQVSSSQQQISSSQQQISASLLNVISVFATTGSNSFRATQSITGSLTVTGQIIAQTLNVQQVTSSIVYSSGSNIFGSVLTDRQTFTGSLNVTGSGTFAGSLTANNLYLTSTGAIYFNEGLALFPYGGHTYIRPYSASGSINFQNQTGSLLVTMLDGGNVGIGTNIPRGVFDVRVASDRGITVTGTVSSETVISGMQGDVSANLRNLRIAGNNLLFNTGDGTNISGSQAMAITSTGIVCIGSTASTTYGTLNIVQQSVCSPSFVRGIELVHPNGTGVTGGYIGISMTGQKQGTIQVGDDSAVGNLLLQSQGGFVGINCTDPKYTLDVNGLVNINAQATGCQGTVQSLRISSNIADAAVTINACSLLNYTYLAFAQNCVGKFELGFSRCTDASSPSTFYLNPNVQSGACNAAIFIKPNGRVGIGAAAPSSKLSVAGAISFTADYDASCPTSIFRENGNKLTLGGGTSGIQFNKSDMSVSNVAFLDSGISCFRDLVCAQGGVKFGSGTGTLNYYEQGTWTPRLTNGAWTSNAGASNVGWYTRVGNLVTVGGTIDWGGGSGSQSSNLVITCLPFASSNTSNERNVGQIGAPASNSIAYICSTKGQFVIVSDPNQVSMYIIETFQNGTYAAYTHGPTVANAGTIYGFQITYHV